MSKLECVLVCFPACLHQMKDGRRPPVHFPVVSAEFVGPIAAGRINGHVCFDSRVG